MCAAFVCTGLMAEHKKGKTLEGKLVKANGSASSSKTSKKKYIIFYFSAKWCGPCQRFTPELVKFYDDNKSKHKDFEVVFVSSDRSAKDQLAYMKMKKMKFPAVKFDKITKSIRSIQGGRGGIPHLTMMDAKGKKIVDEVAWSALDKIKQKLK